VTESDRLSKQDAFLLVYCAVQNVIDSVESLVDVFLWGEPYCNGWSASLPEGYSVPPDWDRALDDLNDLGDLLDDDLIQEIDSDAIQLVCRAFDRTEWSLANPPDCGEGLEYAVMDLENAVAALEDYCDRQAVAAFGLWGWHWFKTATTGGFSLDSIGTRVPSVGAKDVIRTMDAPEQTESEQEWKAAIEARDRWIYEQIMANIKFPEIIRELKTKPAKWQRISSVPGIKKAANRYAERHELPIPPQRRGGRPSAG